MDDLQTQIEGLRRRLRLQNLMSVGVLTILLFAMGGADTVARTMVESPAWIVRTKNPGGALIDRITVTTDADPARIKFANAHLELAQQATAPASPAPGALWYDSSAQKLKYWNNTTWVDASGGGGGGGGAIGGVAGRLEITSSPNTTLYFKQYAGDIVEVNGQPVSIGTVGKSVTTSAALIDSGGLNSGTLGPDGTYYVYISNTLANPNPSSLRLSITQPVLYNGVKYLGTSGNAANWRFIGYIHTNLSTQFEDTETKRLVINYYNRRPLKLALATTHTTYVTYNTASWNHWLNLVHPLEFISNGEDQVYLYFSCTTGNSYSGTYGAAGIGLDSWSTNNASVNTSNYSYYYGHNTSIYNSAPSAGRHTFYLLMRANGAPNTYWYGQDGTPHVRPGAAGYVMG